MRGVTFTPVPLIPAMGIPTWTCTSRPRSVTTSQVPFFRPTLWTMPISMVACRPVDGPMALRCSSSNRFM
jgi:hypothetical protein